MEAYTAHQHSMRSTLRNRIRFAISKGYLLSEFEHIFSQVLSGPKPIWKPSSPLGLKEFENIDVQALECPINRSRCAAPFYTWVIDFRLLWLSFGISTIVQLHYLQASEE